MRRIKELLLIRRYTDACMAAGMEVGVHSRYSTQRIVSREYTVRLAMCA